MPGNCSTYNLFYVAVWSLNEALTLHLLSLYQFLFFLNWFDFLKVLFFLSFVFSFLWLNQSPCFSSHTTCFSHFFDEVRSQSPWFLIFQLWFKLKYTGTHLHWVHWVFAATFTLSEVFVFFLNLFKYQRAIWMFRVNNVAESKAELTYLSFRV